MCVSSNTAKSFQNWKMYSLALEHCSWPCWWTSSAYSLQSLARKVLEKKTQMVPQVTPALIGTLIMKKTQTYCSNNLPHAKPYVYALTHKNTVWDINLGSRFSVLTTVVFVIVQSTQNNVWDINLNQCPVSTQVERVVYCYMLRFNHQWWFLALSYFGCILSVGAICFEHRCCASKKGRIGGGGWA